MVYCMCVFSVRREDYMKRCAADCNKRTWKKMKIIILCSVATIKQKCVNTNNDAIDVLYLVTCNYIDSNKICFRNVKLCSFWICNWFTILKWIFFKLQVKSTFRNRWLSWCGKKNKNSTTKHVTQWWMCFPQFYKWFGCSPTILAVISSWRLHKNSISSNMTKMTKTQIPIRTECYRWHRREHKFIWRG